MSENFNKNKKERNKKALICFTLLGFMAVFIILMGEGVENLFKEISDYVSKAQ